MCDMRMPTELHGNRRALAVTACEHSEAITQAAPLQTALTANMGPATHQKSADQSANDQPDSLGHVSAAKICKQTDLPEQWSNCHSPVPDLLQWKTQGLMKFAVCFFTAFVFAAPMCFSQVRGQPDTAEELPEVLQQLPTDRRVLQQLEDLSLAIESGDLQLFRENLENLRSADPALMVPGRNEGFVPLHRALIQRLGAVTGELRQQVEADEVLAKASLTGALRDDGVQGLVRVLHQFSGTPTSLRIHLLLSRVHQDRGQHLAARFWLTPLLNWKEPAGLESAIRELRERLEPEARDKKTTAEVRPLKVSADQLEGDTGNAGSTLDTSDGGIAGPDQSLDDAGGSTQEFKASPVADGGQAIDGAEGSEWPKWPKHLHWVQSMPLSAAERVTHRDYVGRAEQRPFVPWTAWQPEIDRERVYVRSPDIVVAFDRVSGQPVWTRKLRARGDMQDEPLNEDQQALNRNQIAAGMSAFSGMLQRNETAGRMTSDAERLYVVSETVDPNSERRRDETVQLRMILGRDDATAAPIRELIAYEKSTGRRLWTVGGPPIEQRFGNELSNAWFAGPPAVFGARLYLVMEKDSVISLVCLSGSTGQVEWQAPLVFPELPINRDPTREGLSARTMEYQGAVLTSTTTGWIIAIDTLTGGMLWAQRSPLQADPQMRVPQAARRFAQIRMADMKPHEQTWRSEDPHLTGNRILWSLAECSQLFSMNPLTGRVEWVEKAKEFTILLHIDPQFLVMASGRVVKALRVPDMEQIWREDRGPGSAVPVGCAERFGDRLMVPLSDGSVEVRDLLKGKVQEILPKVRSGKSAGGIYADAGGVINFGIDQLSVLGQQPADEKARRDQLRQAEFLLESGQLEAARDALGQVHENSMNGPRIRQLTFRIALTAYARGGATASEHLAGMEQSAVTAKEKALSYCLRVETELQAGGATLPELLVRMLREDPAILAVEIPEPDVIRTQCRTSAPADLQFVSLSMNGLASRQVVLKTWLYNQLRQILGEDASPARAWISQRVGELSDAELCQLNSEFLVQDCLNRVERQIQSGEVSEQTLHLLFSVLEWTGRESGKSSQPDVAEVAREIEQRLDGILDLLQKPMDRESAAMSTRQLVSQRLLSAIANEIRGEISGQPGGKNSLPDPVLVERWRSVDEANWKLMPVTTVGQMNMRIEPTLVADPTTPDDAFLAAFQCSLKRDTAQCDLKSLSGELREPWRMPLSRMHQSLFEQQLSISRYGSILIIQGRASISAFSVLDQRWLWTRNAASSTFRFRIKESPFTDYTADRDSIRLYDSGRRYCGATRRWLCLGTDQALEVLDLLTGERLWSMQMRGLSPQIYACNQAILMRDGGNGKEAIVDPATGQTRSRKRSSLRVGRDRSLNLPASVRLSALSNRIIRATGPSLVVWDSESAYDDVKTIDWVNAETLETEKSIPLPGMVNARFLDPDVLAAFTANEEALLVNLTTGELQTVSYRSAAPNAAPLRTDRIGARLDAENLYVYETIVEGSSGPSIPVNLMSVRCEEVRNEIRAVNRKTGQLRWGITLPRPLYVCFDHLVSPILLAVEVNEEKNIQNNNGIPGLAFQGIQGYRILGYSRQSGKSVLDYPVVSQFPVPGLRLQMPTSELMELDAFGNRARLLRAPTVQAP